MIKIRNVSRANINNEFVYVLHGLYYLMKINAQPSTHSNRGTSVKTSKKK